MDEYKNNFDLWEDDEDVGLPEPKSCAELLYLLLTAF
jgi:hypothetical protein